MTATLALIHIRVPNGTGMKRAIARLKSYHGRRFGHFCGLLQRPGVSIVGELKLPFIHVTRPMKMIDTENPRDQHNLSAFR
jgi:hypothetical protein